jgi:hypothetical protein
MLFTLPWFLPGAIDVFNLEVIIHLRYIITGMVM